MAGGENVAGKILVAFLTVKKPGRDYGEDRFDKFGRLQREAENANPAGGAFNRLSPKQRHKHQADNDNIADDGNAADGFEILHGEQNHQPIGQRDKKQLAFDKVKSFGADTVGDRRAGREVQKNADEEKNRHQSQQDFVNGPPPIADYAAAVAGKAEHGVMLLSGGAKPGRAARE